MKTVNIAVPILPIKLNLPPNRQIGEAPGIDAPMIRMAARTVEGLDPANSTKQMICRARVELIGGQIIPPFQKAQIRQRNKDMLIGGHPAQAAIAMGDIDRRFNLKRKPHRPAMASALKSLFFT